MGHALKDAFRIGEAGLGWQLQQDAKTFGAFVKCLRIKRAAQCRMHQRELHGHLADAGSSAAVFQLLGGNQQVGLLFFERFFDAGRGTDRDELNVWFLPQSFHQGSKAGIILSGKDDAQHIQVLTSTTALACPTPASTASTTTVAAGTIAQAFALT